MKGSHSALWSAFRRALPLLLNHCAAGTGGSGPWGNLVDELVRSETTPIRREWVSPKDLDQSAGLVKPGRLALHGRHPASAILRLPASAHADAVL